MNELKAEKRSSEWLSELTLARSLPSPITLQLIKPSALSIDKILKLAGCIHSMEFGESILDCINEEELSLGDGDDVDMMDIEDGEVVDDRQLSGETIISHTQTATNINNKKRRKNKNKKNKNKKQKPMPRSDATDIDRFVLGACKRLREPKSYMMYTAVGVLGIPALRDLLKEVDAVQACGGQKTALGDRFRTAGGVLWNIIKTRDPNAYKEIMKKGKDFEKQFKRPFVQPPSTLDDFENKSPAQEQAAQPSAIEKRGSVLNRIRMPVSYDDLPGEEPPNDGVS